MTPAPIRLTAVDDHPVVLEGIGALIARESPDVVWLGAAASWADLRGSLEQWPEPPDVVLFDLNLEDGSDPVEGIAELTGRGIRVVVFTSQSRPVPLRNAIAAGAVGLALKSDPPARVIEVIRTAHEGDLAVSSDFALTLATDEDLVPHLAPRELEALRIFASGVPRKQVGRRMDPPVEVSTVVTYLGRALEKYRTFGREVNTTQDVLRAATADGYLDLPGHPAPMDPPRPTAEPTG